MTTVSTLVKLSAFDAGGMIVIEAISKLPNYLKLFHGLHSNASTYVHVYLFEYTCIPFECHHEEAWS